MNEIEGKSLMNKLVEISTKRSSNERKIGRSSVRFLEHGSIGRLANDEVKTYGRYMYNLQ